jgi:hypothetical protein
VIYQAKLPRISITKPGYHNLPICYSRTIAYFLKTAILFNRRRFSAEHFHRFFRGRDSMKWNEESCRSYFAMLSVVLISGFALLRPPAG